MRDQFHGFVLGIQYIPFIKYCIWYVAALKNIIEAVAGCAL